MTRTIAVGLFMLLSTSCSAQDSNLTPLVGTWRVSFLSARYGSFIIQIGREVVVAQAEKTSLSWRGNFQIGQSSFGTPEYGDITASLKRNPSGAGYLLNFNIGSGSYGTVENMPLMYAPESGFSGSGTMKVYGTQPSAKATIIFDKAKGEYEWKIETSDEKVSYRLTFSKPLAAK